MRLWVQPLAGSTFCRDRGKGSRALTRAPIRKATAATTGGAASDFVHIHGQNANTSDEPANVRVRLSAERFYSSTSKVLRGGISDFQKSEVVLCKHELFTGGFIYRLLSHL